MTANKHLNENKNSSAVKAGRGLLKQLRPAITLLLILTLITGIAYPLLVTGISQIAFPDEANGSQITDEDGNVIGSDLIGQPFSDPKYFWGRLSASNYDGMASGGTNYGPSNEELAAMVQERIDALHAVDPGNDNPIPSDLVTASSSGLDPHISYAAALYQMSRVAREQAMGESAVLELINKNTTTDFTGNKFVNVLNLNLDIQKASGTSGGDANVPEAEPDLFLGIKISDWVFIIVLILVVLPFALLISRFITNVYDDERPGRVSKAMGWIEDKIYRPAKVDKKKGMTWKTYLGCLLLFNFAGFVLLMAIMMLQGYLPLNPQGYGSIPADLAFNTAVSFITNTNWQAYAGEACMSYFTQMAGFTVQSFLSAATGLAVLVALIRGIKNRSTKNLGNFWVDMTRATFIMLPIAFIISILLVSQGVVQTLDGPISADLLDPYYDENGELVSSQIIAVGPVASQESIKLLGTNGAGFFNANSAHPFENPTAISNVIEIASILLIPVSLCFAFGSLVRDKRQGLAIFAVMAVIFIAFASVAVTAEMAGNPTISEIDGVSQESTDYQLGGNLEGKEVRFGVVQSALFAVTTTATSCGAVNSMHDSYTAIGGMCPLFLMQFGEVVFGGVGSGFYGMLTFVLVAVFIAGLMIGRMPEYLGKKIEQREMKLCAAILILPIATILIGTAIAVMLPDGRAGVLNPGPHGFSEILYAFTSATNNNGSAFAGLSANSLFYNVALGLAMLIGRFGVIGLTVALAGSLSEKKVVPATEGTLPTHTPTFILWLLGVVVLFGALSYFLTLALGPIAEALM